MPLTGPDILLYEKKDRIVTITINRPERMNALSVETLLRLEEAWETFRDDDDAWVCVLTGAGDRAFCTGLDLKDQAEIYQKGEVLYTKKRRIQFYPLEIWKPIIAAVNGYAVAGGFNLAQHCDVRIAAENAEFGVAETRWNMGAGWVADLTHIVGLGHALEIVLWGDARMPAKRAYEIGFVNRVVPKEKLMEEAMSWAERSLNLGPRSVRNLKEILYRGAYLPTRDARAFANALEDNLLYMEDSKEGPRAFAEKRKPRFQNR